VLPIRLLWQPEEQFLPEFSSSALRAQVLSLVWHPESQYVNLQHVTFRAGGVWCEPPAKEDHEFPCPYQSKQTVRDGDSASSHECTVLENLKKLELAHSAYQFAEFLRVLHEPGWAELWYEFASKLCPGSRIDQLAAEQLAELHKKREELARIAEQSRLEYHVCQPSGPSNLADEFPRPDIELPLPLGHDRMAKGGLYLNPGFVMYKQEKNPDTSCPYLREKAQKAKDAQKQAVQVESDPVENLKKLQLARFAYQCAEFLNGLGQPELATSWYWFASKLCPGSRIDELAQKRGEELAKQHVKGLIESPDIRQVELEWDRPWIGNDHPSHLTPDRVDGEIQPNDDPKPNPVQVMLSITIADVPRGRFLKDAPHLKVLTAAKREKLLARIQSPHDKGQAKFLAEPRLITPSGHQASFLQGGQQAVTQPDDAGQASVQFEDFGTRVTLLPRVLENGKIRLEVEPEISRLDPASGTTINGVVVPGRVTQRIHTAVKMHPGETLAIGGLTAGDGANNRETLILVKAEIVASDAKSAPSKYIERAYPVDQLFAGSCIRSLMLHGTQWSDSAEAILELVKHGVAPNAWQGQGGRGVIHYVPLANALFVRQTAGIQEQISRLLEGLAVIQAEGPPFGAEEAEPVHPATKEAENHRPAASLRPPLPPIDGGIVGAMQTLYLDHVEKEKAHLTLTVIESSSQPVTPPSSRK
jgi:hypothetical protein